MSNPLAAVSNPKRTPALLALLLLFVILAIGFKALLSQLEETVRQNIQANLVTIGELKVGQMHRWLAEARKDTEFLLTRPAFVDPLQQWMFKGRSGQSFDPDIASRLEDFRKYADFKAVDLFDADGLPLQAAQQGPPYAGQAESVRRVVRENQWRLVDFYRHPDGQIELGLIMPVRSSHGGRVAAALLVVIDPIRFLYPLIQSWPVASETGETLLVQADNARVKFLNPLRFAADAALSLSLPLDDPDLPAARAARGEYGVAEGVDYRGHEVLSYTAPVPETPWSIVVKLDIDEAYAPLRRLSAIAAGVFFVFLLLLLGLVWLFWREQRYRFEAALSREQSVREGLEGRLKAIFDHSADGILVARTRDMKFVLSNRAIARMLGYTQSELAQMGVGDIHPQEHLPEIFEQFEQLVSGERTAVDNLPVLRKDGSVLFADLIGAAIELDGEACQMGLFRDVSERKQAQEQLRASEERLRLSQAYGGIITWEADLLTNRQIWSDTAKQLGFPDIEQPTWESFVAVIHPDDRADVINATRRHIEEGAEYAVEYRITTPKGELRWMQSTGQVERDAQGKPVRMRGVAQDITARKRAEKSLRDSDERFRLFLNHNPIIAWLVDEQGRYVYLNRTYEERFGAHQVDWLGKTRFEVWPEKIARNLSIIDRMVLDSWQPVEQIDHTQDAKGARVYWMTFKFPFRNADGEGFVGGVGIDVTERMQAERAIERLNAMLRDSNLRLQNEIEAERRRIAHALHDEIGQNLTALSLYLHRLAKRVEHDEACAQITDKMEHAVVALGESIRHALSDLRPVLLDQVGLNVAIRTLVREFETTHGVAVDLTFEGEFSDVPANLAQAFYRFLQESLTNVAKHANATEVQVTFRHSGDQISLDISDNGGGFGPAQPSYGLLGMHERAREVGGQVVVGSIPGRGAHLSLVVPIGCAAHKDGTL